MKTSPARRLAWLPVVLPLLSTGCAPQGPEPAEQGPAAAPARAARKVGVSLSSMNHNFFSGMRQGVEDGLKAEGLEGDFVVADDSASTQQQQVDQLIQKGVAAIIMVPVDAEQAVNAVKAANSAGIPIFCIDRRVTAEGAKVTCTVETDNVGMGEVAARHGLALLARRHGLDPGKPAELQRLKATVVHLWGLEAASSARDRAAGIEKVIHAKSTPGLRVLKAVGNFNAKTSQEQIAPMLAAHPEIELIVCHNDDNAIGALNAVRDARKGREPSGDGRRILIVGIDGNRAAIEEVRKGDLEATVSQEPIEMGLETARQVRKVLDGSPPDKPYIPVRHHLVTGKEAEELRGKLWADQLRGGA